MTTTQYIDWDDGYRVAAAFVENVAMKTVIDNGDVFEESAPCGCYRSIACSHPSAVGLCSTHHAEAFAS